MTDLRPIYFAEARERLIGNRLAVYTALLEIGPATGTVLSEYMGWPVTSVRPRLTELRGISACVETGVRRNGEHEFRALSADEMRAVLDAARREEAECSAVCAPADTTQQERQMQLI